VPDHESTITSAEVMPLLLAACPSFSEPWAKIESENTDNEYGRLHYLDSGEFAGHLVDLVVRGDIDELPAVFRVIERLHVEGDDFVRELATIGYLEAMQNVAGNEGVDPVVFEQYLLPESLRWWRGLNAFWERRIPVVSPVDE
jgi:hypothetical protein